MPVDNEIYNAPGDVWWDENQPLHALRTLMNPARMRYFTSVFSARGVDPAGKVIIDIGCGGGLFAEDVARLGASVIGIDPAPGAIAAARKHAAGAGLAIDYRVGPGEHLPADDACADIVYCVDVLEHVADVGTVVGEAARVLKPGGLFLFDTINRTRISKLVLIRYCQDWPMTAWLPPGLHDWNQFITPAELRDALARHHLREEGMTGLKPGISPPALILLTHQVKKGKLSYAEFGRRSAMVISKNLRASYIGHATKLPAAT
ncbi:MAG TPA: bifunctional 2-polyprenyl-6-hydroxyphenol methylase/3-demethylubiquinol 3-O-methyltransferase UbiG [Trebonia sp.]